ncbi:hypothetical protein ISF_07901 [Cordyceps fumosorosea ARSEF 2679]|uniref:Central kinetochore-associated n=1 Tax=Cordyceps fumosorosea (strain ARSEF 2679) TaxID=1081104 RepID=A0A162MFC4_CORFA|nr:hypothetical protein ISF_07901 [Cordyceps fumosorosea ARSEF 2679]OAA55390.1 hypothetical protein ISF_07901 [Cordyceps fumosorosea ARSEF 2679]
MYPLSPAHDAVLNCSPSSRQYDVEYEVRKHTVQHASCTTYDDNNNDSDTMSSPLVSNTSAMTARSQAAESGTASSRPGSTLGGPSLSPAKSRRHSRVISGTGLSPLKILSRKRTSEEGLAPPEGMGPPPARSARKISSPEKRFPVKIGGGGEEAGVRDRQVSLEEAMRTNGHLRRAIDIFEDDEDEGVAAAASRPNTAVSGHDEAAGSGCNPDDTMTSTFSTFSAAPTLASYANWRAQQSPAKLAALAGVPSSSRPGTRDESGNTTNLLMDFTDSLRHPARRATASPDKKLPSSSTLPNLSAATATPSKTTTLIDFDIPPLPTPRSVPTISSRELESLKSAFLSEISSLKASLSGKEAEVRSLKAAVGDAEARVGASTEGLREQTALREQAVAERDDWERRGREVEEVLHRLRREREEAERKLEESEKRREAAEILHQEAESKIAGLRAGRETTTEPKTAAASPRHTNKEVEIAVERVARELHTLYKGKHETKVTALKKSYEARWEKKVKELERRVQELREENAGLLRATTGGGGADPEDTTLLVAAQANAEADKEQATRDRAAIRELNATVRRLEAVVASVQGDNGELRGLLERERVEKGELVQLAEEMMAMQQQPQSGGGGGRTPAPARQTMEVKTPGKKPTSMMPTTTPGNNRRGSVGKASGLRAPGSAYRGGAAAAGGGLRMPGPRSGILSGIEKMGSHRGRGQ